jgi:hypothetical protein
VQGLRKLPLTCAVAAQGVRAQQAGTAQAPVPWLWGRPPIRRQEPCPGLASRHTQPGPPTAPLRKRAQQLPGPEGRADGSIGCNSGSEQGDLDWYGQPTWLRRPSWQQQQLAAGGAASEEGPLYGGSTYGSGQRRQQQQRGSGTPAWPGAGTGPGQNGSAGGEDDVIVISD